MMSDPSARKEALLAARSLRTGAHDASGHDVLAAELACPRAAPADPTHSFTMAGGMLDTGFRRDVRLEGRVGDVLSFL